MFKKSVLMVLAAFCLAGVAKADGIDDELRAKDAAKKGAVKTFSYIDEKENKEYVYDVTPAQAKVLPEGDMKNATSEAKNAVEAVIAEIRKQEPKLTVAIHPNLQAATVATWRYRNRYVHYDYGYSYNYNYNYQTYRPVYYPTYQPTYHSNPYYNNYCGGSFYYEQNVNYAYNNYNTVYPYYGRYQYNNNRYANCYWYR